MRLSVRFHPHTHLWLPHPHRLEREAIHSLVKKRKSVTGPSRDPYAELAETSQQVAALDEQRQRRRMNMQQREKQHAETREEAKGFLVQVALSMRNEVYAPGDRLPPRRLYIITRGTAIYRGRVLNKGDSFGEQDVMLTGMRVLMGTHHLRGRSQAGCSPRASISTPCPRSLLHRQFV